MLVDRHGTAGIDHDTAVAGPKQTIAKIRYQADRRGRFRRLGTPVHLRQVDDHPVGIGQGKNLVGELFREFENESRVILMNANSGIRHDLRCNRRYGAEPRGEAEEDEKQDDLGEKSCHSSIHLEWCSSPAARYTLI